MKKTVKRGEVTIKLDGKMYEEYNGLRGDDRVILDALIFVMEKDTNRFVLDDKTLEVLKAQTGYVVGSIKNAMVRLVKTHIVDRLPDNGGYYINPTFAIKGSECKIWKFIQSIQYKGNVPREVTINCHEID